MAIAEARMATTSGRVTSGQTQSGPAAPRTCVTLPAASTSTETVTTPSSPVSFASLGYAGLGTDSTTASTSGTCPNAAQPNTPIAADATKRESRKFLIG